MRKLASFFVLFGLCAMPAFAAVETYKDVSVVDVNCSKKVAADPDSHTRACALKCEKSGYGIMTQEKRFLKFDASRGCERRRAGRYLESDIDQTVVVSDTRALVHLGLPPARCARSRS